MSQSLERRIEGRQGNNAMLVGRTNLVAAQRRSWGRAIAPKATPPPSRRLDGELGFDDDCFTSNYLDGLTYTCRTGIDIRCCVFTLFSGKAPFPVVRATDSTLGVRVFCQLTDSKTLILADKATVPLTRPWSGDLSHPELSRLMVLEFHPSKLQCMPRSFVAKRPKAPRH